MTFDEWFNAKYPPERYQGADAELAMMRLEYREVWDAAFTAAQTIRAVEI